MSTHVVLKIKKYLIKIYTMSTRVCKDTRKTPVFIYFSTLINELFWLEIHRNLKYIFISTLLYLIVAETTVKITLQSWRRVLSMTVTVTNLPSHKRECDVALSDTVSVNVNVSLTMSVTVNITVTGTFVTLTITVTFTITLVSRRLSFFYFTSRYCNV